MKILHTSDFHLGRNLYGKKRYDEFSAFLDWLVDCIRERGIEALVIAGDLFDTSTPSNRAQRLYFRFIKNVSATGCRHIVVIGGNHDSPSLIDAPKELLQLFQVRVIGAVPADLDEEVLMLQNESGEDELIVCAIPYLRDRDIRFADPGESIGDKDAALQEGITAHYRIVVEKAVQKQQESEKHPPILATGHLFAAGGHVVEGDGVRDLYVGSLVHVPAAIFPKSIDYLALGHLHSPQLLAGNPTRRYSGSPLPMSFGEAKKSKSVVEVHFHNESTTTNTIEVPCFQELRTVRGTFEQIVTDLNKLRELNRSIWLEVLYEGDEVIPDLQQILVEEIEGTELEILRIVNRTIRKTALEPLYADEELENLNETEVFRRCLLSAQIDASQHDELHELFTRTLNAVHDEDRLAE